MASRKNKKKREQKKRRRSLKGSRLTQGLPRDTVIVTAPAGERKMSEVLLEYLEPYSEGLRTEEEWRKLVTLGLVGWNGALMPDGTRANFIEDMAQTMPPELRSEFRAIAAEMIQRKLAHFANNKRTIINYELTMTPAGPHLVVLSTLSP